MLASLPGTNPGILLWVESESQIRSPSGIVTLRREQKPEAHDSVYRRIGKEYQKPVNYEKVKVVIQDERKIQSSFRDALCRLLEYSQILIRLLLIVNTAGCQRHLISQSAPHFRHSLQKSQ